ncbi:hypothetical protein, partial [Staphylococcus hominis]
DQGQDPLEYDGSNEMYPTPGDQSQDPLADGSEEVDPTPGDQSQDPLADEPATEDNQGTDASNGSNDATTDAEGNTVET